MQYQFNFIERGSLRRSLNFTRKITEIRSHFSPIRFMLTFIYDQLT